MDTTNSSKSNESVITDHYVNYRTETIKTLNKKISKSRDTLFIVAGLALLAGLIQIAIVGYNDGRGFKYTMFIAIVFVALGFFTKKEPFAALVMSLIIYIGLWVLTIAIGGPEYIFNGIIGKAIIIFFIASGIPHAQKAEELKKELKKIKE